MGGSVSVAATKYYQNETVSQVEDLGTPRERGGGLALRNLEIMHVLHVSLLLSSLLMAMDFGLAT